MIGLKEERHFSACYKWRNYRDMLSKGLDYENILRYGREKGSAALRKMTFQQRGEMLKSLALYLHKERPILSIEYSYWRHKN